MTTTVSAYAATSATGPLTKTTIERRDVGPHDVAFDIKFAGICHSDIHTVKGEWGEPNYPVVPGHEIAGVVTEVGSEVTKYKVGDHVGVGCMVGSCQACDNCKTGLRAVLHGDRHDRHLQRHRSGRHPDPGRIQHGHRRRREVRAAHPRCIPLDKAAPLLCAGITLFSPLHHWGAGPGKKVAIIGLGGLGHMGVKIAHAMGAEVTVLSQSLKKMEDGLRLGADHYYATSDPDTFTTLAGSFDLILNTVSANLDMGDYLDLLAVDGTLVELGAPEQPLSVPFFPLGAGRRSIAGSMIGGIPETQEMLDFCAKHGVTPEIEIIEPSYVNEAYERVLASDVRYRFVIDTATL